jgi:hypothetical protein
MLVHLVAGVVERRDRRARQLELAARLQRDVAGLAAQRDDLAVLLDRLPAEAQQPLQDGADAVRPLIGQRPQVAGAEGELLVLGADAPLLGRLAAGLEIGHELPLVGDRLAARLGWR